MVPKAAGNLLGNQHSSSHTPPGAHSHLHIPLPWCWHSFSHGWAINQMGKSWFGWRKRNPFLQGGMCCPSGSLCCHKYCCKQSRKGEMATWLAPGTDVQWAQQCWMLLLSCAEGRLRQSSKRSREQECLPSRSHLQIYEATAFSTLAAQQDKCQPFRLLQGQHGAHFSCTFPRVRYLTGLEQARKATMDRGRW